MVLGSMRLCFRFRPAGDRVAPGGAGITVVTGLVPDEVTVGDVSTGVGVATTGELDCEGLLGDEPMLLDGPVMFAKSASESRLIVARYDCAPF